MSEEHTQEAIAEWPREWPTIAPDPFGITTVFSQHLEMSLQHSHPEEATKAAYAAVASYLRSYKFINTSHKGTEGPSWRMVQKRDSKPEGRDAMK